MKNVLISLIILSLTSCTGSEEVTALDPSSDGRPSFSNSVCNALDGLQAIGLDEVTQIVRDNVDQFDNIREGQKEEVSTVFLMFVVTPDATDICNVISTEKRTLVQFDLSDAYTLVEFEQVTDTPGTACDTVNATGVYVELNHRPYIFDQIDDVSSVGKINFFKGKYLGVDSICADGKIQDGAAAVDLNVSSIISINRTAWNPISASFSEGFITGSPFKYQESSQVMTDVDVSGIDISEYEIVDIREGSKNKYRIFE